MSKHLPLFVKITFIILLVVLAQISTSFAQRNPRNTVEGEKTYIARPMPYDKLVGIGNVAAAVKAGTSQIKGFAATGTTGLITCVTESGREVEKVRYVYRLFLDEESLESSLKTNQRSKTAEIKLVGNMRVWEQEFVKNDPNCKVDFKEINGGRGGLDITMRNKRHVTPLNFMAGSASGRVYGPVMNDSLSIASGSNPPTYVNSVDTGFVKKLIPKQNQQLSPEALKRMGVNLPPGALEQLKQNQQIAKSTAPDHRVDGILKGGSKDKALAFVITTGFDADMMVYKPKAMASSGGGGGGSSANFNLNDSNNSLLNGGFLKRAGFSSDKNRFFSKTRTQDADIGLFIPKRNREKVQAFVNLDNDNMNDTFDIYEDEKVANKDNDLVKVKLRIKKKPLNQRKGLATFRVKGSGEKFVRVWERDPDSNSTGKDTLKEYRPKNMKESDYKEFRPKGDFLIKELWIEGINPMEDSNTKAEFEFKYFENGSVSGDPSVKDDFKLTVIGIESIKWEGNGNGFEGGNDLDSDYNHRNPSDRTERTQSPKCTKVKYKSTLETKSIRVFPGARLENETVSAAKDTVFVKVTLSVPPVDDVKVYLKSFDVDDPLSDEGPLDYESKTEDNRGVAKGTSSKSGYFIGGEINGIYGHTFSAGAIEQKIEFRVTKQPGDNFRVVGSSDKNALRQLTNRDYKLNVGGSKEAQNDNKQRIVDDAILTINSQKPKDAEILEKEKYSSKVLTVWRFFYAEVDYMEKIEKPYVKNYIKSIEKDTPTKGLTTIYLQNRLIPAMTEENPKKFTNVATFNGKNGVEDSFRDGELEIPRVGKYSIARNSAVSTLGGAIKNDYVVVNEFYADNVKEGTIVFLRDDDSVKWGFETGIDLKSAMQKIVPNRIPVESGKDCGVEERYIPAYIIPNFTLLNSNGRNKTPTSPFVRNLPLYEFDTSILKSNYRFEFEDYEASEDFWTVYLLMAYKGATYEDGDPNTDPIIQGVADTDGVGIHIFLESMIEKKGTYYNSTGDGTGEKDTIAHEIAHLFGSNHNDQKLMSEPTTSRVFSNITLNKIRSAKHP